MFDDDKSPVERAVEELERRREVFDYDQDRFNREQEDHGKRQWALMMWRLGRARYPYRK